MGTLTPAVTATPKNVISKPGYVCYGSYYVVKNGQRLKVGDITASGTDLPEMFADMALMEKEAKKVPSGEKREVVWFHAAYVTEVYGGEEITALAKDYNMKFNFNTTTS